MSISKRVFFENLSEDDPARADIARSVSAALEHFTVRARLRPTRTKRDLAGGRRDPFWESARDEAISELRINQRHINGVPHFTTAEDRDRVHELAIVKWNSRREGFEDKRNQPVQSHQISRPVPNKVTPALSPPFILNQIPPDPRPTEDDLRPYLTGSSGVPELDRFNAETEWREARIKQ
ncbi:hypothetical protein P7L87_26270, partial [Vibrio parahaemolyticus]|nr:hypothetical protein [Vibrio parahaemolyticus]